jgi:ubiquinone/menaquinone biosynthesis C-methylase UbiE
MAGAAEVYALGSCAAEIERLGRQAEELAADSAALLDRASLLPGQAAIDLGCGPRGVLDLLAERVAPGGRVVGVDADPAMTAMARQFTAGRGLSNVEIMTADARHTGLPSQSFDLVHTRTLLINVPGPAEIVAEMARLAKAGGWVVATEPDSEYTMCYPPHPAVSRLSELFQLASARNGADSMIGRRVHELFRQAGLDVVGVDARCQMFPPGHSRRTIRLELVRAMRPHIVAMGLASDAELEELDVAARAHVEDPATVTMYGHLFHTWARKSGT